MAALFSASNCSIVLVSRGENGLTRVEENGDGDNDVLVFGANGAVVMHENLGDRSEWRTRTLISARKGSRGTLTPSARGVVDVDGDDEVRATRPPCSPSARATLISRQRSAPRPRSRPG